MCRRKTFTLIYRVNFCNMSYFSQGLFHCFSAFRFFFNCLVTQRTMPCSCHVRTMLLPCWRRGESESCFPSGGDRGAVTHACVFTCSPPKQRHALDSRPCVELMAFTRLAGQLWLFFFFSSKQPRWVHRHFIYYFGSNSGYPSFLQIIYIKLWFLFFWGGELDRKCSRVSHISVFQGHFMDSFSTLVNHAAFAPRTT